jgi:glycosyltransferase involved in cell wall biosynthesis
MQLLRQTPLVSVVMSVRNDARFVAESIDSILRQTAPDFEFIIFDDGSIDSSRQVISSFTDARIKMFGLGGVGLASALNQGLGMARGTYVARQDADDISAPERFEQQIAYLESNPEIDVLGTAVTAIDQEGRRLRDYEYPLTDAEIRQELCRMHNPLVHGSLMYRKQRILDIHGYRPAFRKSEDYDMHLRAARYLKFANLEKRLLQYRVRLDSMSGGRDEEALQYSLLARALAAIRNAGMEDSDEMLPDFERALRGWSARQGIERVALSGFSRRSAVISWYGGRRFRALRELGASLWADPLWPIRERVFHADAYWTPRIEDDIVALFRSTVEKRCHSNPACR